MNEDLFVSCRRRQASGFVPSTADLFLFCLVLSTGATEAVWAQPAPAASDAATGDATAMVRPAAQGAAAGPHGGRSLSSAVPGKQDHRGRLAHEGTAARATRRNGDGAASSRSSRLGSAPKWGRIGIGLWFLSSPSHFYGGQVSLSLEGGARPWVGGRVAIGGAILPLSSEPLDDMPKFEAMAAAVFGVGPVLRISGIEAVARALRIPLDLELALLVSTVANRPMVAVTAEIEFDVRYGCRNGWWIGGAIKGGWWHVMTEAVEGKLSLGPAFGAGIETGWSW